MTGTAALVCAFGLFLDVSNTAASTIAVTTASGIPNEGLLDWGALGSEFSPVSNGFTTPVPGIAGLNTTGSEQTGFDFLRLDQGSGWNGNFGSGEELLWTFGGGPVDFAFSTAIDGFGAQIQAAAFGAFTARIEAFDAANLSLGFFTLAGDSNQNGDDSAIFLGILSSGRDIRRVSFSLTSAALDVNDFAINSPLVDASVPEPGSILLLATGTVGVIVRRYYRRA